MMIRALILGVVVAALAGLSFFLLPADSATRASRGAPPPETIVSNFPVQPSTKDSVAKIEAANLWGIVTPAPIVAVPEKIVGKILGAVSTSDTRYVLLQVGKQTPVELKVGDLLPVAIEPFGGGKIVDIRADRITVLKNGEKYVISISN